MFIEFNDSETMLIDDDFQEKVNPENGRWNNVIDAYEKRNLNVGGNLARSLIWWCNRKKNGIKSLPDLISVIKATLPRPNGFNNFRFLKYEEEVYKYIMLL